MSESLDFERILVPIDFSQGSRDALDRAAVLARMTRAELILLHVVEPLVFPTVFAEQSVAAIDLSVWTDKAEHTLRELAEQHRVLGLRVRTLVQPGQAAHAIIEAASAENADLIVIGSSGHRSAAYAIFGSTVERVTRKAPCPVLVTRSKVVRAGAREVNPRRPRRDPSEQGADYGVATNRCVPAHTDGMQFSYERLRFSRRPASVVRV
jgi:nucleotide-binding universal stress UspA family protein